MPFVRVVQSFDGHPLGAVVELSQKGAESAVIQRRGVLVIEAPATKQEPEAEQARKPASRKAKK
jgi:hypothetical protein